MLKKFDPTTAPSKQILISYFCKVLRLFILAQIDYWKYDLDLWKKVVEKAIDTEAKTNFQPSSGTREIDSKYLKSYRPSTKKE